MICLGGKAGRGNPYYVWVSEIMLQQTRTEAVKPYFESWKRRFPTIEALAEAEEADVTACMAGTGLLQPRKKSS